MFALVRNTTDFSSAASTMSCSARGKSPRTIGSTFPRVSATLSACGSTSCARPSDTLYSVDYGTRDALGRIVNKTETIPNTSPGAGGLLPRCRTRPGASSRRVSHTLEHLASEHMPSGEMRMTDPDGYVVLVGYWGEKERADWLNRIGKSAPKPPNHPSRQSLDMHAKGRGKKPP